MYEYENGFSALLDELENLHDKNGNRIGKPFPFRKAQTPHVHRIAKVTRSRPVSFAGLEARRRRDYSGDLDRQIESLNKAMTSSRAATISRKPRSMDLRKAMTNFNANLRKAMSSGDLTPDEVCRLEAYRNRLTQLPMTGLI